MKIIRHFIIKTKRKEPSALYLHNIFSKYFKFKHLKDMLYQIRNLNNFQSYLLFISYFACLGYALNLDR